MQETHNVGLEIPRLGPAHLGSAKIAEVDKKQRKPPTAWKPGERPVGRAKGTPNKVTQTLREAVELAARDCHPQGLAGWLVERAQGGVQDRQIFAGLVGKVIPIQVNQAVSGGVSINLNWLGQRNIGTIAAQPKVIDAQTIDLIDDSGPRRWIADESNGQQGQPVGQQPGGESATAAPTDPHPPSNPT